MRVYRFMMMTGVKLRQRAAWLKRYRRVSGFRGDDALQDSAKRCLSLQKARPRGAFSSGLPSRRLNQLER
jgi:hypothetical protein